MSPDGDNAARSANQQSSPQEKPAAPKPASAKRNHRNLARWVRRIAVLTVASALVVWRTRIHLLWLLGAGAVVGALGWV